MASDGPPTYATTIGGLKVLDDMHGDGAAALLGEVVTVRFSGTLHSRATRNVGVIPEPPWQHAPRTETFAVGDGKSAMWEEAVLGMRVGGRRVVLVPPSASIRPMNSKGRELSTPAGDTIRYTCELCAVRKGAVAFGVRSGLMGVGSLAPAIATIVLTNMGCYFFYAGLYSPQPADAAEVAVSSRCSTKRLLESRAQLDLAVQVIALSGFGWLRMASDGFGWLRMASVGFGWLRMAPDGFGWLRISFPCFGLLRILRRASECF